MGLFNPATIWVLIPLAAIIGSMMVKSQRIRAEAALRGVGDDKIAQELRDAILRLETRVANLERAVTTAETERKYAL
jgi:hypothetical protein|uniref:Phage shock protein B n=1 Tax=uncultured organism TaxID=155900 RepID=A0A7L9QC68_9ZZZZ|nr:hypothetical protein [uncultured organism]